jgi:hypothetical protein
MTRLPNETCANCGELIGQLEQACIWRESVVCPRCHARLLSSLSNVIVECVACEYRKEVPPDEAIGQKCPRCNIPLREITPLPPLADVSPGGRDQKPKVENREWESPKDATRRRQAVTSTANSPVKLDYHPSGNFRNVYVFAGSLIVLTVGSCLFWPIAILLPFCIIVAAIKMKVRRERFVWEWPPRWGT